MQVWIFKIAIGRLQYEFERICDDSGEDPYCSRFAFSWSISSLLFDCVTDGMSSRKHLTSSCHIGLISKGLHRFFLSGQSLQSQYQHTWLCDNLILGHMDAENLCEQSQVQGFLLYSQFYQKRCRIFLVSFWIGLNCFRWCWGNLR